MIELMLENYDNDKRLRIKLPIVPRIGDWIRIDDNDEFAEGENLMIVKNVILSEGIEAILIMVTGDESIEIFN